MDKIIAVFVYLDGKKTYLATLIGAISAIIHFIALKDYSLVSLSSLMGDASVMAIVASIRHAMAKTHEALVNPTQVTVTTQPTPTSTGVKQ